MSHRPGEPDTGASLVTAQAEPLPPSDAAASTTGASVMSGGIWVAFSYVLPQLYIVVVSVVAARFLAPADMGRQSFIAWAALSIGALLSSGLGGSMQRYTAEMLGRGRPEAAVALLWWGWRIALVLALAGGSALTAIGLARDELESAWILAGVACAASLLHTAPFAVVVGYQRFRQATVVGIVTGAFGVVGVIAALALGYGIPGMFAVEALVGIAGFVWVSVLVRRIVAGTKGSPLGDLRPRVARYAGLSTVVGGVALIVEKRSELIALERYSSPQEIAYYSISFAALAAMLRLVEGLAAPVVPAVATLYGAGESERIGEGFSRAVRLILIFAFPAAAAGIALGPAALRLAYGEAYEETGTIVVLLLSVFPALALYNLISSFLDGVGRLGLLLAAMAFGAVLDVGLAFALVPAFDARGAALANMAGQTATAALLLLVAHRLVGPFQLRLTSLLRVVAASLLALAATLGVVDALPVGFDLFAGMAAFALVFGGLAILLRIMPRRDAEWMDGQIGERLGGRVGRILERLSGRPDRPPAEAA